MSKQDKNQALGSKEKAKIELKAWHARIKPRVSKQNKKPNELSGAPAAKLSQFVIAS